MISVVLHSAPHLSTLSRVASSDITLPKSLAANADARFRTGSDHASRHGTKYLVFQLMTADPAIRGQPDTPHVSTKMEMDTFADQLLTSIGERGDVNRQLGMVIGPLSWDMSD